MGCCICIIAPSIAEKSLENTFEYLANCVHAKSYNNLIFTCYAMQQNIKKTLAKAIKERGHIHKDEQKKNSKRNSKKKPSLLRMLSAHIVPSSTENIVKASNTSREKNLPSVGAPSRPSPVVNPLVVAPKELQGQRPCPYSTAPPSTKLTKPCPLCGDAIQLDLFDQHMQDELTALGDDDDDDDDSSWNQPVAPLAINQIQKPVPPRTAPLEPKVYILGGTPTFAVPRNPKKLKPLPEEYRRQIKPVKAYNYYADGGGDMDGDEVGIDGFTNVGVGWEGVGATTF